MKRDKRRRVLVQKRGRCSGHCCTCFWLPYSPEELEAKYTRWLRIYPCGRPEPISMSTPEYSGAESGITIDIHIIYPMLIYLGTGPMPKQVRKVQKDPERPDHYYSCKHWDQSTGNCTIYEHRPQMCREYPYRGKCNYAACTWKSRKYKPRTAKERREERKKKQHPLDQELVEKPKRKGRMQALHAARRKRR